MAFAGQAPPIIVLKEGAYYPKLRQGGVRPFANDLLRRRDGYLSGQRADRVEHQCLRCSPVHD